MSGCFGRIFFHSQIQIHLQSQEQSPGSSRFQFLKSQQPKHLTHKMIATIRDTTWPSQDRSISILLWSSYRTGRCTVSKNLRDLQMFPLKTSFPDFFRDVCLDSFGPTKSGTCRVPFFEKTKVLGNGNSGHGGPTGFHLWRKFASFRGMETSNFSWSFCYWRFCGSISLRYICCVSHNILVTSLFRGTKTQDTEHGGIHVAWVA